MGFLVLSAGFIFGTLALLLLFMRFVLVVVTVHHQSMSPTLEGGDRVLVWRNWPSRWLRKGQIVIVAPGPLQAPDGSPFGVPSPYIKRIVAMPGETFTTLVDQLHEVLRPHLGVEYDQAGKKEWKIPEGHVFLQGDFPVAGADSRVWGPVPVQKVLGVVLVKLSGSADARAQDAPIRPWPDEHRP